MKEIVIPSRSKSIRGTVKRNCSKWAKYSGNNSRYTDFVNQRAWNLILIRVSKLRKEVSEIDLKEIHNLEDTFSALVKLVSLSTTFFDEGLIRVGPTSKTDAIDAFNSDIQAIMRREKTPLAYWNSTKPNEEVNFDSLYIGDAVEVSKTELKKKKVPAFLLKEYNGKTYKIVAPMSPASKWLRGKMKPLIGAGSKTLNINICKFMQTLEILKSNLLQDCDNVLEGENL